MITQANSLKSSGDQEKDIAALIELSKTIQNEASKCRKLTELPIAPQGSGTRKHPIPVGTKTLTYGIGDGVDTLISLSVTNAQRSSSFDFIKPSDVWNVPPNSGYEYLLIIINLQYLKGDENVVREFSEKIFDSVTDNQKFSPPFIIYSSNDIQGFSGSLYPEGELTGYATYLVKVDDTKPILLFDGFDFLKLDQPVFFAGYE